MSLLTQTESGRLGSLLGLAAVLLLAGCGREDVQVYEVPKAGGSTPTAGAPPPPGTAADNGTLRWKLPPEWYVKQGDAMRVGSFGVTNSAGQMADISVIPLGGLAGGELPNVNRWRGQVGLPPVQEAELAKLWEPVAIGPEIGKLMDMDGNNPAEEAKSHILAAILTRGGTTWFFKMTGGHELVAAQKTNFVAFLKSIEFGGGVPAPGLGALSSGALPDGHPPVEGPAGLPPGHPPVDEPAPQPAANLPAGHPPIEGTPAPPAANPAAALPAGAGSGEWVKQSPKPMQTERFTIKGAGGEAEVSLSELAGDGGGALPNVNRWRQQIGLGPIDAEALTKLVTTVDAQGAAVPVVDMANDATQKRVVAASVPKGARTLFYKLMGDSAVVGKEKEKFIQYVRAAQ